MSFNLFRSNKKMFKPQESMEDCIEKLIYADMLRKQIGKQMRNGLKDEVEKQVSNAIIQKAKEKLGID